jgi:hypothetical protein
MRVKRGRGKGVQVKINFDKVKSKEFSNPEQRVEERHVKTTRQERPKSRS